MKRTRRTMQVGGLLRDELARIIRRELNDPDLAMATVSDVEMSPDLRFARVWLSTIGDEAQQDRALEAVRGAQGRIRRDLASTRAFRWIPDIEWRLDRSAEYATRIESRIREVLPEEEPSPESGPESEEEKNDDAE